MKCTTWGTRLDCSTCHAAVRLPSFLSATFTGKKNKISLQRQLNNDHHYYLDRLVSFLVSTFGAWFRLFVNNSRPIRKVVVVQNEGSVGYTFSFHWSAHVLFNKRGHKTVIKFLFSSLALDLESQCRMIDLRVATYSFYSFRIQQMLQRRIRFDDWMKKKPRLRSDFRHFVVIGEILSTITSKRASFPAW